jgi:hypothetical protein
MRIRITARSCQPPPIENLGFLLDAIVARLRELGAGPEVLEQREAIMTRRLREIDDADSIVPDGAAPNIPPDALAFC